jgi:hypothetical protein
MEQSFIPIGDLVTFSVICFPEKCRPGKNKNQLKVAKSRA